MAAVVSRCYTAATRSIATMSVAGRCGDHFVRTAGMAVTGGCLRSSPAAAGHRGAVSVDPVAVLRCCTAESHTRAGTSGARAARTRRGTWCRSR